METVRQHKKLVTFTIALLFFTSIGTGFYLQTMLGNQQSLPPPSPEPTPTSPSLPSSSPSASPSPSQTSSPFPHLPSVLPTPPTVLLPQEITNYEGEDLSPISTFMENSIEGPQNVPIEDYRLTMTGLVDTTMAYEYNEVLSKFQKYQKVVTLHCVEGWSVKILWEGFLLKDLLETAGIDNKTTVVIFYAYDGYSTSLPLDYILNNEIIIAYKINNVTLPPERGFPFQLVAESKWGYKWIKWITAIELSDDQSFLGYWESRGYPNDADLP